VVLVLRGVVLCCVVLWSPIEVERKLNLIVTVNKANKTTLSKLERILKLTTPHNTTHHYTTPYNISLQRKYFLFILLLFTLQAFWALKLS